MVINYFQIEQFNLYLVEMSVFFGGGGVYRYIYRRIPEICNVSFSFKYHAALLESQSWSNLQV